MERTLTAKRGILCGMFGGDSQPEDERSPVKQFGMGRAFRVQIHGPNFIGKGN